MSLKKLIDRVGVLEHKFSKVNFENGRQLKKLFQKIQRDLEVIKEATKQNEEHLKRIQQALGTYEKRKKTLEQRQGSLAKLLADKSVNQRRFDEERELHRVQLQLRSLEREHKDYQTTRDTLRSWILNLDQSHGLLEMMSESLQRNLDRLGIVLNTNAVVENNSNNNIHAVVHSKDVPDKCPSCFSQLKCDQDYCTRCGYYVSWVMKLNVAVAYENRAPNAKEIEQWIRQNKEFQLTEEQRLLHILEETFDSVLRNYNITEILDSSFSLRENKYAMPRAVGLAIQTSVEVLNENNCSTARAIGLIIHYSAKLGSEFGAKKEDILKALGIAFQVEDCTRCKYRNTTESTSTKSSKNDNGSDNPKKLLHDAFVEAYNFYCSTDGCCTTEEIVRFALSKMVHAGYSMTEVHALLVTEAKTLAITHSHMFTAKAIEDLLATPWFNALDANQIIQP